MSLVRIAGTILLLSLAAWPRTGIAGNGWDFSEGGGWTIREGAREVSREKMWAVQGGEKVILLSPPLNGLEAAQKPILRMRLRTDSPRRVVFFWQNDTGAVDGTTFLLRPSGSPRRIIADLRDRPGWKGKIVGAGLSLEGPPGLVEIHDLELDPFRLGSWIVDQWQTFASYRGLTPGTINGLSSPILLGRPVILFLNILAMAAVVFGAIAAIRSRGGRRIRTVTLTGGVLLIFWITYDLRETGEQASLIAEISREFLSPAPEARTFPGLGDLYRFAEFCGTHIPPGSVFELIPYPCWPYDCRLKNLLYPSLLLDPSSRRQLEQVLPRYRVVRHSPDIVFAPGENRLYSRREQRFLTGKGRLLARYDPYSYIFVEEAQ